MAVCERDGCADFPPCVDPGCQGLHERLCRDETAAEPARTLHITVTDADGRAAGEAFGLSYAVHHVKMRRALECFAGRLAERQWVKVPADATIPPGIRIRTEGVRVDGTRWAHEDIYPETPFPPKARYRDRTFLISADRLGDLIYPVAADLHPVAAFIITGDGS